jgi:hypothetical protein
MMRAAGSRGAVLIAKHLRVDRALGNHQCAATHFMADHNPYGQSEPGRRRGRR